MKQYRKRGLAALLCAAMAFQLAVSPAAKSATAASADMTRPVITITPVNGHYNGKMYCEAPAITVHDDGGNLISVVASTDYASAKGTITDGTDCTVSIEGLKGSSWTVTAIDGAGNEAIEKFYVGHQPAGRQIVDIAPTCTKPGTYTAYSNCANCGERFVFYSYNIPEALGHEADMDKPQEITPCGTNSETITVYPCIRCQALLTKEGAVYAVEDGEGHLWESKKDHPSCEVTGTTYEECTRCKVTRNVETIPASGHSYGNWSVTKKAECGTNTPGEKERSCTKCGAKDTQIVAAEHTWSERMELKAATCTEAGYTGFKCTVCNQENPEHHIEIAALGHSYEDDGDCTTESVCSRKGCGRKLPATQHKWGEYDHDQNGHWQKCANEGCTKTTKDITGAAEAHSNAPENKDCTSSWDCPVCGYQVKGYASHTFDGTWKSDGTYHWQECTREGCTYQQKKGAHTGGDDGDCTTAWKCKTCKATLREAAEHKWSENYSHMVNSHRRYCTNPGCNKSTDLGEHIYTTETGDCTKSVICAVCDYVAIHGESGHRFVNAAYHGNETGHWQECTNKNCKIKSKVTAHTGGTATCRDQAVCETCRMPYGELNPQNHTGGVEIVRQKAATVEEDGYTGDEVCLSCKAVVKEGKKIPKLENACTHNWEIKYDDIKSWEHCTICYAFQKEKDHTFIKWLNDAAEHWQQCEYCEHMTHHSPHIMDTSADDKNCNTPVACKDCQYTMIAAKEHVFGNTWAYDEDGHWHVCINDNCEQTSEELPHNAKDDGDCTTALICKDCGHTLMDAQTEHNWSSVWKSDAKGHYQECQNDGCTKKQYQNHKAAADDGLCTTPKVCEVCEWVMQEGAASHNFGDYSQYQHDESGHWHMCQTPGCTGRSPEVAHSGGKATCAHAAVCDICHQSYGGKDPEQHDGGVEIRNYEAPTEKKDGYSGDTYCIGCGLLIATGKMLNKLPAGHTHVFDYNKENGIYASDDIHHWLECPCGEREEVTEHTYGKLQKDNTHHWDICTVCGKVWRENHIYENGKCTVCGAEQPVHEHEFKWNYTENTHWQECGVCGDKKEVLSHAGGKATCISKAVCTDCGQPYGEKDPLNHTGKTGLRGQKKATATETGYTGDTYCLDCGQKLKAGTVIPALGKPTPAVPVTPGNQKPVVSVKVSKNATLASKKHSVKISWKPDKNATAGYRVYVKSGKKYVKAGTVKAGVTSLTIKKIGGKRLKAGTTYKVRIVSLKKVAGKIREGKKITYTTATKPTAPKWSSVKRQKGTKAILKWKKVSGVTGYEIQMSKKAHTGYKKIKRVSASKTSYKKAKLSKKAKYYFRIRTYKKVTGGYVNSAWSKNKKLK